MVISAEQKSKFAALRYKWSPLHMSEIFSSERTPPPNNQTNKQNMGSRYKRPYPRDREVFDVGNAQVSPRIEIYVFCLDRGCILVRRASQVFNRALLSLIVSLGPSNRY